MDFRRFPGQKPLIRDQEDVDEVITQPQCYFHEIIGKTAGKVSIFLTEICFAKILKFRIPFS